MYHVLYGYPIPPEGAVIRGSLSWLQFQFNPPEKTEQIIQQILVGWLVGWLVGG